MTLNGFINTITKEIMTKPCTQYSSHHEIPIVSHKDQHQPKTNTN
jgi:hypothetical protein